MENRLLGLSKRRWPLGGNQFFRLLSAYEMTRCAVEAANLTERLGMKKEEEALAGNAVLLSMSIVDRKENPVFPGGEAVLSALPAEGIISLAERYAECRDEALGTLFEVKKN